MSIHIKEAKEAMEPLIAFQGHCEQVERELPGDIYAAVIANFRALQQALKPINEELLRTGVMITENRNLYNAKIKISYVVEHINEIVIQVVVLQDIKPISKEALRKRLYIARLIKTLIVDIQKSLESMESSVLPGTASYNRGNLSLIVSEEGE